MDNSQDIDSPKDYLDHCVFTELQRYIDFYYTLQQRTCQFEKKGSFFKFNTDSYLFLSIHHTLDSILTVLRKKRINDAYYLLRKYQDMSVINIYIDRNLEKNTEKWIKSKDLCLEHLDNLEYSDWIKGLQKLPNYRKMICNLKLDKTLTGLNNLLLDPKAECYKEIRVRCNDHVHFNTFDVVLLNIGGGIDRADGVEEHIKRKRRIQLETFVGDLRNIFIFHLAYMLFTHPAYMAPDDFDSKLNVALSADDDGNLDDVLNLMSQVDPFFQKVYDETLKKYEPEVAKFLESTT